MIAINSFHWPNTAQEKPTEDAHIDITLPNHTRLIAIADGVTRRGHAGPYPNPSPATSAAQAAVRALCAQDKEQFITGSISHILTQLGGALRRANDRLKELNRQLSLWGDACDYWEHDLAGCAAAITYIGERYMAYSYLTDCSVALIRCDGQIVFQTPDNMVRVQAYMPQGDRKEVIVSRRQDYRNQPLAQHSYGVLNGEPDALAYICAGYHLRLPGDVVVTYTDGAAGLLEHEGFRSAIAKKDLGFIKSLGTSFREEDNVTDEGTLVMAYDSD